MIDNGQHVRLLQVPPSVEAVPDEQDEMNTKNIFRECIGQVFRVRGIGTNNPHGETDHIELWVLDGLDCDDQSEGHTIWVEQEYVEVAEHLA